MRALSSLGAALILNFLVPGIPGVGALDPPDPHANATYFVFTQGDLDYVVGINPVRETGDVYIHMSGPDHNQWAGVGFGAQMQDSLMLVSYASANGSGVTTSPRIAHGQREPTYVGTGAEAEGKRFEKIWTDAYAPFSNQVANGIKIMHGVCRNCTSWSSGALDLDSTAQPFVFAVGPRGKGLKSEEPDAPLGRHEFYGQFTMDMTKAVSPNSGRVPAPNIPDAGTGDTAFTSSGSSGAYDTTEDHDFGPPLHALTMLAAFVLVFPFGALVLRLVRRVLWHAAVQAVGMVLVVIGFGTAIYVSREFNRSRDFNSAHQIIGLLIFAVLFIQLGLGLAHHERFKRTKKQTIMGKVHRYLGPGTVVLALVNGGLGFILADDQRFGAPYAGTVAGVAIIFAAIWSWTRYCISPRLYSPDPGSYPFPDDNTPITPWSATPLNRVESASATTTPPTPWTATPMTPWSASPPTPWSATGSNRWPPYQNPEFGQQPETPGWQQFPQTPASQQFPQTPASGQFPAPAQVGLSRWQSTKRNWKDFASSGIV